MDIINLSNLHMQACKSLQTLWQRRNALVMLFIYSVRKYSHRLHNYFRFWYMIYGAKALHNGNNHLVSESWHTSIGCMLVDKHCPNSSMCETTLFCSPLSALKMPANQMYLHNFSSQVFSVLLWPQYWVSFWSSRHPLSGMLLLVSSGPTVTF